MEETELRKKLFEEYGPLWERYCKLDHFVNSEEFVTRTDISEEEKELLKKQLNGMREYVYALRNRMGIHKCFREMC